MKDDVVINAQGLGKRYDIGHNSANREDTLRDTISHGFRHFARTTRDIFRGRPVIGGDHVEEFWALRDVCFDVVRGETVGIIGRNGAGKSTLLKILSRITEPTEGRVAIKGRVASLLEVGTGFHPELTGRENIYLNGAILGMKRAEIRRKFDEIVDFAGVARFLDTPVKRYSSGMYVRLAFAVAAHLEPEILIVDEVLAVGDAEFQRKCLGKMRDVAGQGRTVLFVSHNIEAIRQLCTRGIYLAEGRASGTDSVAHAIERYTADVSAQGSDTALVAAERCRLEVRNEGQGMILVDCRTDSAMRGNFAIGAVLETANGQEVFETGSADHVDSPEITSTMIRRRFRLPIEQLRPGEYTLRAFAYLHNEGWLVRKEDGPCVSVSVAASDSVGPLYLLRQPGFGPVTRWHDAQQGVR